MKNAEQIEQEQITDQDNENKEAKESVQEKTGPKKSTIRQAKYDAKAIRRYGFKLHKVNDRDIIEKFDSVKSIQGYVKMLVRKDIGTYREDEDNKLQ